MRALVLLRQRQQRQLRQERRRRRDVALELVVSVGTTNVEYVEYGTGVSVGSSTRRLARSLHHRWRRCFPFMDADADRYLAAHWLSQPVWLLASGFWLLLQLLAAVTLDTQSAANGF